MPAKLTRLSTFSEQFLFARSDDVRVIAVLPEVLMNTGWRDSGVLIQFGERYYFCPSVLDEDDIFQYRLYYWRVASPNILRVEYKIAQK